MHRILFDSKYSFDKQTKQENGDTLKLSLRYVIPTWPFAAEGKWVQWKSSWTNQKSVMLRFTQKCCCLTTSLSRCEAKRFMERHSDVKLWLIQLSFQYYFYILANKHFLLIVFLLARMYWNERLWFYSRNH